MNSILPLDYQLRLNNMPPLTLNRRKKVVKKVKKVKMVEHKIDLDTLLVAYKIGAISIYDIKRFIKLSK